MAAATGFQRFVQAILPRGFFEALEAGTRTYMLECPCGHKRDLWEAGGLKYEGTEKRTLARCPDCGERTWHHKRKKRPDEIREAVLGARRDVVMLSAHAWWASAITWGVASLLWACPVFVGDAFTEPWEAGAVWMVAFVAGWIAPYLWMTTRYRIGRTELTLHAGFVSRTLELRQISLISPTRQGVGLSFAFDTDFLWIGYPSRLGGYLVSPKEKELFLELLDRRCSHLEMRDGSLSPVGQVASPPH